MGTKPAYSAGSPTEERIEDWILNAWDGQFSPMAYGPNNAAMMAFDDGSIETEADDDSRWVRVPLAVMRRFLEMAEAHARRRSQHGGGK